jgi:hypothetical protein
VPTVIYSPGRFLVHLSVRDLQGYSAGGRIKSNEKSNVFIGNRTFDFPAFSVVPQSTMLSYAPARTTYLKPAFGP